MIKNLFSRLAGLVLAGGVALAAASAVGVPAQAATCTVRTTHYAGTTASGTQETYTRVTRACGATKTETFAGSYAYSSGEKATETRSERWARQSGAWVVQAEHETRVAHYATGRTTTTVTNRVGCHETRTTTTVTGAGTRTTTTTKPVC